METRLIHLAGKKPKGHFVAFFHKFRTLYY